MKSLLKSDTEDESDWGNVEGAKDKDEGAMDKDEDNLKSSVRQSDGSAVTFDEIGNPFTDLTDEYQCGNAACIKVLNPAYDLEKLEVHVSEALYFGISVAAHCLACLA